MDSYKKLRLLAKLSRFECEHHPDLSDHIYHASTPKGKKPILKVMQATHCDKNCDYCVFRRDRDETPRVMISPKELAKGFMELYRQGRVDGLFLSSGIFIHPEITMEKMLDTIHILRDKYNYNGYVHLKIMPGVSKQTLEEAVKLANRVSLNLESPNERRIKSIAKGKSIRRDILPRLEEISRLMDNYPKKSHITQVMVGVTDETDYELLRSSEYLYRKLHLNRVYYSAFFPVKNTPLENRKPESKKREHRLYQADFLIRDYGFSYKDLVGEMENLSQDLDPKEAWALRNMHLFPVEINKSDYHTLIRVPGVGTKTAREILRRRREKPVRKPEDLKGIRNLKKILNYVLLDGKYFGKDHISLFSPSM